MGPIVAGSFYSANPDVLRTEVQGFLAEANRFAVGDLRGLIVPHAGYGYSGPVAATAYALLAGRSFERIVLVGPSHFVRFEGLAAPVADVWRIPLGEVTVERAPDVPAIQEPYAAEHCLEVQLPFLHEVLGPRSVMPILTGDISSQRAGEALDRIVDDHTLLVVSTDLSHYLPYEAAQRIDARTAAVVVAVEPERLDRDSACGRTGLQAALLLARRRSWEVGLLDLRNSGDTSGDRSRVVGYGAFALSRSALAAAPDP